MMRIYHYSVIGVIKHETRYEEIHHNGFCEMITPKRGKVNDYIELRKYIENHVVKISSDPAIEWRFVSLSLVEDFDSVQAVG